MGKYCSAYAINSSPVGTAGCVMSLLLGWIYARSVFNFTFYSDGVQSSLQVRAATPPTMITDVFVLI
jgi:hypothetical protein